MEYPKVYLYKRIVAAKMFIDAHYAENIDLDNIANEAHFSKFHFIRIFKTVYGKTPYQYLTAVRMEKAMLLLRAEIPVTDVCYTVGFESPGTFSSLFKRRCGLSPSDYLLQQRKRRQRMVQAPRYFVPGCFAGSPSEKKQF